MELRITGTQVGGSLAGLLHGLYLKRHGSHVVILEQEPASVRSSHQAGIGFGPAVEEILRKYDATDVQSCTPSVATRIAYRKRENFKELKIIRHLTSWGLLYHILRANFDGLASEAVPNPPPAKEGDGKTEYRAGQRVTNLQYENGAITVGFVGEDGVDGSLTADLVIGADGIHSTVRGLVQAPTIKEYSSYVAWRGAVCESDLPIEVAEYFSNRTSINLLKKTYIVW
jgi:2-polyprenyl-6-methoxyphenol hydroxylase-like FAD-dependent oxidoreductase